MASFLEEYEKLRKKFPFVATVGNGNDNCDYSDNLFDSKNCYFVFESAEMEDCMYTEDGFKEVSDVECRFGLEGNGNCDCLDFASCSNCYGSQSIARCYDVWYSWDIGDCHDCFGCANLANKAYCIFNVQYTKEEYEEKLPELKKMPKEEVLRRRAEVIKKFPQLHSEHFDYTNSDYCDYVYHVTNCYYCFDCANDEDSGYLTASYECKDVWDSLHVVRGEQLAECSYSGDIYNCYKVTDCTRCYDSYFLEDCLDCHNCFGCTHLSHKQYCILNVQYTKEEYNEKIAAIKEELGLKFQNA